MSDLLQTGAAWLRAQQKTHVSRSVVYSRGAATVSIDATIGRTEMQSVDPNGIQTNFTSKDFIITPADLVLNGSESLPQAEDEIEFNGDTYCVLDIPNGQPYQVDPQGCSMRIHTKLAG